MKKPLLILTIITFFLYIPSLAGQFIWDDEDFVYSNRYVEEFQVKKFFTESVTAGRGKPSNYYRPLQLLTYSIDHALAGFQPWIFHFTNVLWHMGAVGALFNLLYKLKTPLWIAFCSALVFTIHPIQTEAVSYISGRSDMMYVAFLCGALTFYLTRSVYGLLFFALALLSKESALIAVGIVPVILWHQRKKWSEIQSLLPYILVVLSYLLIRLTVLDFYVTEASWTGTAYGSNVFIRLNTFFSNYFTYLKIALFPMGLHMERDLTIAVRMGMGWWTYGFISLQIAVVAGVYFLRKWILWREAVLGWVVFTLCMLFYSGIILLNGYFYEHFLYFALPFLFLFLFSLCAPLFHRFPRVCTTVFILYSLFFVLVNVYRQYQWNDPVRLYTHTLQHAPHSVRVRNNLGMEYAQRGRIKEAEEMYLSVIDLQPDVPNAYHNLANLFQQNGNEKKAMEYYEKTLEVSPGFLFSYQPLLRLYTKQGEKEKHASLEAQLQQILQK